MPDVFDRYVLQAAFGTKTTIGDAFGNDFFNIGSPPEI